MGKYRDAGHLLGNCDCPDHVGTVGMYGITLTLVLIIIIYFLADALIQGDLQLLQDIALFLHTIILFFTYNYPFIQLVFTGAI